MSREVKVPIPTLERLATYLRYLSNLGDEQSGTVLSADIEKATGIRAAQFRKDLSYFGEFGRPGIGYNACELRSRLARILKVDRPQSVILVGAGNLGVALAGYTSLRRHNFNIVAIFDSNPDKVGRKLCDLTIQDISHLRDVNRELKAKIAIITVPARVAQKVADELIHAGVELILNFAPTVLRTPPGIMVRNVYFIQELTVLSYYLKPGVDVSGT